MQAMWTLCSTQTCVLPPAKRCARSKGWHHHQGHAMGKLHPAGHCAVAAWCDGTACTWVTQSNHTCNCRFLSAAAAFSSAVFRRLAAGTYTVPPAAAAAACPTRPCPVGAAAYPILHSDTHTHAAHSCKSTDISSVTCHFCMSTGAALQVRTVSSSCFKRLRRDDDHILNCAEQVSAHLWYVLYCSSKAKECR